MDIIKELEVNLKERLKLLDSCEKEQETRVAVMRMCKEDPVFFFKYFAYTDRNPSMIPQEFGNSVPFVLFPYQVDFLEDAWDAIKMGQLPISERTSPTDVFSEKSRQMWFSWTFWGLQLYAFLFHNMKSLYISMKADEVDNNWDIKSHFEKIRFMIRHLPSWMLPEWLEKSSGTDCNKFMNISRKDWTWSIVWESANANAGRWGTTAFTIFDEMAFMQYATSINMSVSSATPCRFFNSTPNGEWNEYFRMRTLAIDGKVRHHRCHWSEHPCYTQEWYDWKTKGMTKEQIAQELEIDYNTALKGRVYTDFTWEPSNIEYDPVKPLYIAIDNSHGWADPHAIILMQPNHENHFWDIIDTLTLNCKIEDLANMMSGAPRMQMNDIELEFYERYKNYNWRQAIFVSDPYDTNSAINNIHHTSWTTIAEDYMNVWIHLNVPSDRDKRSQIIKTKKNVYRIRVHERCADFISAIQNARYPEIKEWSVRTKPADIPIHDWTSHYRTALEYLTCFMLENFIETKKEDVKVMQEIRNPLTWELQTVYI